MNRIVMIAAALFAAPFAASAEAQSATVDRTQVVSFADLDLSRDGDIRKLDRRIAQAVKQVCGTASDADLEGRNEVRRCRTATSERFSAERGRAIALVAQPTQVASASGR